MAFRFKLASCIAVGTFNMYIIQPSWLTRIDLYPKGTKFTVYSKWDEQGNRFIKDGSPRNSWTVYPTRIELETDNYNEDCGSKIGMILERLPETPLKAIGSNFIYEAPLTDLDQVESKLPIFNAPPDRYTRKQRATHITYTRDEYQFIIQLSQYKDKIELIENIHVNLVGVDRELVSSATSHFFKLREEAEQLTRDTLKLEISHDARDPSDAVGGDQHH